MTQQQPFVLEGDGGREIHGVVHVPETGGRRPAVVICHGFKSFLEWGFHPPLADLLSERGFVTVRFNFPGTGMKPGDELVTDEAAFASATLAGDLADLRRVLAAVGTELAPDRVDPGRLGLVGHSRGGGVATLAAAHDDWRDRLGALVTWAAVASYTERYGEDLRRTWRENGHLPIDNARTGQRLRLGLAPLEELERRGDEVSALAAADRVRAPWLIAHGAADETVPAVDAERLHERATTTRELLLVPGGSHTFGAQHPFVGPTAELVQVMNATQIWLRRHLG